METIIVGGDTFDIHPAANAYPLMDEVQLLFLKMDIEKNAQLVEPIIMLEGKVIDGRNRLLALQIIEKEINEGTSTLKELPEIKATHFKGYDHELNDYLKSLNAARRHLTPDQKIMIFGNDLLVKARAEAKVRQGNKAKEDAELKNLTDSDRTKIANKRADQDVAEQIGTNYIKVRQGIKLNQVRPDLADKIAAGEMNIAESLYHLTPEEIEANKILKPRGQSHHSDTPEELEPISIKNIVKTIKALNAGSTDGLQIIVKSPDGKTLAKYVLTE